MTRKLFLFLLVLLSLSGALLLLFSIPRGMGLSNDSVAYISGARSLLAGEGYGRPAGDGSVKPITHFPPLFSLLLAVPGLFGMDAIDASLWVNLALFAGNIFLCGLLALRITGKAVFGLFGAGLFAFSDALLRVHSYALSEPLFLLLTLAGLYGLIAYFQSPETLPAGQAPIGWLIAAGVLAGLSTLARYVGGALFAVALAAILVFVPSWRRRFIAAAVFLVSGLPWVVVWSLRNALLTGSATNRSLVWHPLTVENLLMGVRNFWSFLLPIRLNPYGWLPEPVWAGLLALFLLALLAALSYGVYGYWRFPERRGAYPVAVFLVGLHALAYLAYLLLSMTLLDASTTFEHRILSPLYADLILLLSWGFYRAWTHLGSFRWASAALALVLLLSFADDARKTMLDLRLDGQGFANSSWTSSETMAAVRALPVLETYTNRLTAVTLLSRRPAFALLGPIDPVTEQPRPGFDKTQASIHQRVQDGRAFLVIFSSQELLASDEDGPWLRALVKDLPVLGTYKDGIIYGVP